MNGQWRTLCTIQLHIAFLELVSPKVQPVETAIVAPEHQVVVCPGGSDSRRRDPRKVLPGRGVPGQVEFHREVLEEVAVPDIPGVQLAGFVAHEHDGLLSNGVLVYHGGSDDL